MKWLAVNKGHVNYAVLMYDTDMEEWVILDTFHHEKNAMEFGKAYSENKVRVVVIQYKVHASIEAE